MEANVQDCNDHCEYAQDKKMLKKIMENEKIIYSQTVIKINERNVSQKRDFLITNQFLYNINPDHIKNQFGVTNIRRRTPQKEILSVIYSNIGNEFLLKMDDESDFRLKTNK